MSATDAGQRRLEGGIADPARFARCRHAIPVGAGFCDACGTAQGRVQAVWADARLLGLPEESSSVEVAE